MAVLFAASRRIKDMDIFFLSFLFFSFFFFLKDWRECFLVRKDNYFQSRNNTVFPPSLNDHSTFYQKKKKIRENSFTHHHPFLPFVLEKAGENWPICLRHLPRSHLVVVVVGSQLAGGASGRTIVVRWYARGPHTPAPYPYTERKG